MSLDPVKASKNIIDKYLRYIETTFYISDKQYMDQFKKQLSHIDNFAKGPFLDFSDSFELGNSIDDLIEDGVLNPEFRELYIEDNRSILLRKLYRHQELSIRKAKSDDNIVVTTGTGSGKTESFLIPIINYLMDQKEQNQLTDGVRALIIYPMNALANDQMKRLRQLFADYPTISFGSYTGETEERDKDALFKYMLLNDGLNPIINERISREQMKARPPHILITNYAMLEYLLLRPDDNVFFDGLYSHEWKYIVLDEAHTYTGATGIEVSMLLGRLKNVLKRNDKIRFILTSATLGGKEDNKAIADFAARLCAGANFSEENIVRAFRYSDFSSINSSKFPVEIYCKIKKLLIEGESVKGLMMIIKEYDAEFCSDSQTIPELLYDFLLCDSFYYKIREFLKDEPRTISSISTYFDIDDSDVVNFVFIARKAVKNHIALLDAKYHMFLRALEGAYVVFGQHKDLSIIPRDKIYIEGEEYKSYKILVCKYCGKIYIEARFDGIKLVQENDPFSKNKTSYFMLASNVFDKDSELYDDTYELCGKCGKVRKVGMIDAEKCKCGECHIVNFVEVKDYNNELNKCLSCGLVNTRGSILRGFYLGQEAAASVIGSSLYEEIPSKSVEVTKTIINNNDDFFCENLNATTTEESISKMIDKQLLVFSDSRQEAAYFAGYLEFTYNNILRRRLLIEAINQLKNQFKKNVEGFKTSEVVNSLALLFEQYNIVEPEISVKEAWKTTLYEISSNDRNSLENIGLVSFELKPLELKKVGGFLGQDALVIQRVLANSFKRDCMFEFPYSSKMLAADKEYYSYKGIESTMSKTLTKEEGNKSYRKSWLPIKHSNSRSEYLRKTIGIEDEGTCNMYLEKIWDKIFVSNKMIVQKNKDQYVFDISRIRIRSSYTHDIVWFKCIKCGKLTINNINNVCPSSRCGGKLELCNITNELKDNHYRKLYTNFEISPMKVKEHTAQLGPETAKLYQEMFIKKDINVLSCSTTFEMGVDVGELETVFMKNMPPTPANYAQRAGRAGRRKDSAAYALTFCRLSSHDLTYFNSPISMIKGKIYPPKFKIENEKIVKRHMYAVIIAAFWKENNKAYKDVSTFFDNSNFNILMLFVENLPQTTYDYIHNIVPNKLRFRINEWVLELTSDEGKLKKAKRDYQNEIGELKTLRLEAVKKISQGEELGGYINKIDLYLSKTKRENILQFLSKKNIIPKYGFPVDTVELVTSFNKNAIKQTFVKSSKLRLQRDLMIAISEYAPGSEVIADGDIYKSQYIKIPSGENKVWEVFDFGVCSNTKCGHLKMTRHISEDKMMFMGNCEICGEKVYKDNTFIIPEYGFIINRQVNKSTTKKPERTYRGDIYYLGDTSQTAENDAKVIELSGNQIKIKSTSNDELVVINSSSFFVCNNCGYTVVNEKNYEEFLIDTKQHETPSGRLCINKKFVRRTLGHKFKTDVAYISFGKYMDICKALSVMYSLLEGVSQYLGIERNDISGTLHYNKIYNGVWETDLILFDTVPGGAGHVRRIGNATSDELKSILLKSLELVKQCKCGEDSDGDVACYSCLCNYYNQKHHNIIKRKYAIEFLENILN